MKSAFDILPDMHLEKFNQRLNRILKLHFDPKEGSAYWIQKQNELGFSVIDNVLSEKDLHLLGPMPQEELSRRPVEDFIPKKFLVNKRPFIIAETGGRTGAPKTTAYFEDEFNEIFVDNFIHSAKAMGFPQTFGWLWIGPNGPHIIGKAAHSIVRKMSHKDPFSIDFDPRWFRKMSAGSLARDRYMQHILKQSVQIIQIQHIDTLFTTPIVLEQLGNSLPKKDRMKIQGIYLGGMRLDPATLDNIKALFPNAIIAAGYGNTLLGVCDADEDLGTITHGVRYRIPADRIFIKFIHYDDNTGKVDDLNNQVAYGQRGRIVFHRVDESFFIPNVCEGDTAIRLPNAYMGEPEPLIQKAFKVEVGIY